MRYLTEIHNVEFKATLNPSFVPRATSSPWLFMFPLGFLVVEITLLIYIEIKRPVELSFHWTIKNVNFHESFFASFLSLLKD